MDSRALFYNQRGKLPFGYPYYIGLKYELFCIHSHKICFIKNSKYTEIFLFYPSGIDKKRVLKYNKLGIFFKFIYFKHKKRGLF